MNNLGKIRVEQIQKLAQANINDKIQNNESARSLEIKKGGRDIQKYIIIRKQFKNNTRQQK